VTSTDDYGPVTFLDAPIRVLAVDDEPDFLEVLEDYLFDRPIRLRMALDPDQALHQLAEAPADVMLVDLQMPRGGGRRLLAESRRRHPDIYSVVITAYGNESVAVEMLTELGANAYLGKTDVDEDKLFAVIRRARLTKHGDAVAARRGFEIVAERCDDGVFCLTPMGFLTAQPELRRLPLVARAVDAACQQGERRILINLAHLRAATANAMGLLLGAVRRLERAGGSAAIYGADHIVARCLLALDRRNGKQGGLPVYDDQAAARDGLAA
jgi:CheY-like chemotaxis protein